MNDFGFSNANFTWLLGVEVDYDDEETCAGRGRVCGWFVASDGDATSIILAIVDSSTGAIDGMKMRHVRVTAAGRRKRP